MTKTMSVPEYATALKEQLEGGHAREHAYRPALERLMRSFEDVGATNDPRRSEHGNPDMIFYRTSNHGLILGYAEAKDINVSLDKTAKSEQLQRYAGYNKLFLTNYLEFRFYRNGEEYERINIGKLRNGEIIDFSTTEFDRLHNELRSFLESKPEPIKNGKSLALIMGQKARRIRDNVVRYLGEKNEKNHELDKIYQLMKKSLVHDLTHAKFADMYAQTLVYGLFAARYNDPTPEDFSRQEAANLVPASNPFLREFFDHIGGIRFDTRLAHIVDELCEVFAVSRVDTLVHKHLRLFEVENDRDPIIHFYEDFLKAYDPAIRKAMGAYYTPVPVVRYIVRQVDRILKEEFELQDGLADTGKTTKSIDIGQKVSVIKAGNIKSSRSSTITKQFHRVQVLDPAVGTATFLNEIINFIAQGFKGQEGRWETYVNDDLLPRLSGFELMMAPYTVAHLKLSMTLQETGVKNLKKRLGIYLTNTLEEGIPNQQDLFNVGLAAAVTEESELASEVKHERPVMVVIGNPPYAGESYNKTSYANGLVDKYKIEPGGLHKLNEPNAKWLYNDYVKFIAFAEDMIIRNKNGIVAMITDNSYLERLTFRGMRWHLAKTFDKIYILDLHGNSNKKETTPDGGKDENVFDIQQGVAIIVAVKNSDSQKLGDIFHADIYGKRLSKFSQLNQDVEWKKITLDEKNARFVPRDLSGLDEYEKGVAVNRLFIESGNGIVTKRDKLAIQSTKDKAFRTAEDIVSLPKEEFYTKYDLPEDVRDWRYDWARNDVLTDGPDEKNVRTINYRPFDKRYLYFTGRSRGFIGWPVMKIMKNYIGKDNVGLLLSRMTQGKHFAHAFITDDLSEAIFLSPLTGTNAYNFPLWIYNDDGTKTPNFKPSEIKKLTANLSSEPSPENVLDYIYAVLHSPSYRAKNKEFLETDFPRVPVPTQATFDHLVPLGNQLRQLHLMQSSALGIIETTFPISGDNMVERVRYEDKKVWINDTQHFGNIPEEVWAFYIGGYQPAQKWLKDRKGKILTNQEIVHYQKIVKVLAETDKLMQEIDES